MFIFHKPGAEFDPEHGAVIQNEIDLGDELDRSLIPSEVSAMKKS